MKAERFPWKATPSPRLILIAVMGLGTIGGVALLCPMFIAQVFEWPHPQIDQDWERSELRWREITPLAYRELREVAPLLHEARDGFMQAEAVDILADGEGLYVCCKEESGRYFARLLPGEDWWKRDYLPLPETGALH